MSEAQASTQQSSTVVLRAAIVAAVLGIILSAVGAVLDIDRFFQIYLVAFLFWLNVSLGCLGLLLGSVLINGRWSYAVQRIAGAGARTMPILAIMFIPIVLTISDLYPWAKDGAELADNKETWLEMGFFIGRAVVYFVVWIVLAYAVTGISYQSDNDNADADALHRRNQVFSIIGMMLFFLTVTFAAFDWIMFLNKDWFSSVYGWLTMSQQGIAGFAIISLILALFWDREPLSKLVNGRVIADLSTLLFVSFLVWGYLNFMQYIVIWSGNTPSKASWYGERINGGWEGLLVFIILVHAVAFFLLVTPGLKRMKEFLVGMAVLLFVMRLVEMYWIVMPAYSEDFTLQWWDIALPIAVGGVWVAFCLWDLGRGSLLPENQPNIQREMVKHSEEESYEGA